MIEDAFELSKNVKAKWYKVITRHENTGEEFRTYLVKSVDVDSINERFDHWGYGVWMISEVHDNGTTKDYIYEFDKDLYNGYDKHLFKAKFMVIWHKLYGPLPHNSDPKLTQEVLKIMNEEREADRQEILKIIKDDKESDQ